MTSVGKKEVGQELSRRELLQMVVPGRAILSPIRLRIDKVACTGCALCARDCPNEAITAAGDDRVVITFRSDLCDSCGICIYVCPEHCLSFGIGDGNGESVNATLFEDEFERCEACGVIIGSRAMVRLVQSKLQSMDPGLVGRTRYCPACKGRKDGDGA